MTDVVVERYFAAPPEVLWSALTSAEALERWFWPDNFATATTVDLKEGGHYRIASSIASMAVSGRYLTIRASELIEFGWQWDGEELTSTVAIELTSREPGAGLTLTHRGLADSEVGNHAQGWADCLDRLPGYLADHSRG